MLRDQQAGPGRKEGALSFRAAITEPAEGLAPPEHQPGTQYRLAPQATVNKKLPSLESQQGSDGEDWVHPMRILLQSPAEQANPEGRKWRCVTWWE